MFRIVFKIFPTITTTNVLDSIHYYKRYNKIQVIFCFLILVVKDEEEEQIEGVNVDVDDDEDDDEDDDSF